MPLPITTRREFLHKGLALVAAGASVPAFLQQTVFAIDNPLDQALTQKPGGKDDRILVVVQLAGGNDGLSTVIPFGDDLYYRNRPALGMPARDLLKIDNYLGVPKEFVRLKSLFDDRRMSIIQGVGYPNPNRSHFRSMDIWHSAIPDRENVANGWLGRYFDCTCTGIDPHVGVSIGETLPLAMKGDRITPLSFEKSENYRYNGADRARYEKLNTGTNVVPDIEVEAPATQPIKPPVMLGRSRNPRARTPVEPINPQTQLDFLTRTATDARVSSDTIANLIGKYQPAGEYPGGEFGEGLRTIAAMIAGGLSTRVYYVSLGGFDTHAGQANRHAQLMDQFARGIQAFTTDLKKQENSDRVLVMAFSEFGRRVTQNASGGTDHGAAGPMFLFGPEMKTSVIGQHPSLANLDQGDLKYAVDFRNVYASILQNWMDTPSRPILGEQFKVFPFLKT